MGEAKHTLIQELDKEVLPHPHARSRNRRGARFLAVTAILAFTLWYRGSSRFAEKQKSPETLADDEFDWDKACSIPICNFALIETSGDQDTAQRNIGLGAMLRKLSMCSVPLDYSKPHGQKAAVALLKYPSKYPVGHKDWKGPILYNPGGPGGSGVDAIRRAGEAMSKIIGDDYDHIGFDPRGIGYTTPQMNVFSTTAERKIWDIQRPPAVNSTPDALGKWYAYAQIAGDLALEREPEVARHVSTAVVARDMLEITRAHGRDKLLYWGFSYGSVLGITYAAMFPDNLERLIVDGVADTENYYAAAWSNNLMDADKNLQMLIDECAGSTSCALHESSPKKVRARLDAIFEQLKTTPIPVISGSSYGIVDWNMAHAILFEALYTPREVFPKFAQAMADIEKKNGAKMFEISQNKDSLFTCDCGSKPVVSDVRSITTVAIACGEGDVVDESLETIRERYVKMAEMSPWADIWSLHIMCSGWKARAAWRYNDPVTPLWAAKKMSKGFKDAIVLTQNSPGHCSLAAPSTCTAKYVREYFPNGTLPAEGTMCEEDGHMFANDVAELQGQNFSEEDRILAEAIRDLSTGF